MPWIGGALSVWKVDLEIGHSVLPHVYASERECAAAVAQLLFDMNLLFEDLEDPDTVPRWIFPDDWARACEDADFASANWLCRHQAAHRYRIEDMPESREAARAALGTHITSARMLHWLCRFHDNNSYYLSEGGDNQHWRFFVVETNA